MCSWPKAQLRLSTLPGRRTSQTHDPRSPLDRERLSLTSQRFLSPLDTDPNRLPPQEPVLSCGDPWAAARARRPSPASCGMGPLPTGRGRASAATSWAAAGARRLPGPRGTAPGPLVRPHGGAHPGPTPHEKAQPAAPTSRRLRLSVTSPAGERGARPPASLRGTMENGPTGQMRSSNPPPGCGGGCARVRKPRPGA